MWCNEIVDRRLHSPAAGHQYCRRWTLASCDSCLMAHCDLHLHKVEGTNDRYCGDCYNGWLQRAGADDYHPDPRDAGL